MSAPVSERTRAATAATIPAQRGRRARGGGTTANPNTSQRTARRAPGTGRTAAGWATDPVQQKPSGTQKAYARREERLRRLAGGPQARGATSGRAQFVLLVMVLLGVGLVATLWLSTAAAADSYRLQDARAAARLLSSQSERLHREVAAMESAPELARRASGIGMVPVQDPARLVVGADGAVTVVGVPAPAAAAAPPVPAAPPAAAPVPADATSQTPADQEAPVPAAGAADEPGGTGATGGAPGTEAADTGDSGEAAPAAGTDGAEPPATSGTARASGAPPSIGAPPADSTGVGQEGAGEDGNGAGPDPSTGTGAASAGTGTGDDSTSTDSTSTDSTSTDSTSDGRTARAGSGSPSATGATSDRTAADAG